MSRRRLLFLIALLAVVWSAVGVGLVSAADETREGGTTGTAFVTNKYIWTGDTSRYGQVAVRYHLEVQAETVVRARWECVDHNGPLDSASGGVNGGEWDVSGDTWNGAHIVLFDTSTYCSYHVWRFSGNGGFRIVTAAVDFWLQEFIGGGGTNPSHGPGSSAGPGSSHAGPSATPSPSPEPTCGGTREERLTHVSTGATEYVFNVVTWCEHSEPAMMQWIDSGGWTQPHMYPFAPGSYITQTGETRAYNLFTLDAKPTPDGGYIGLKLALSPDCEALTGTIPAEDGASATWESLAVGTLRYAVQTLTVGVGYQPCGFVNSHIGYGPYGPTTLAEGSETWFGPPTPGGDMPDDPDFTNVTPTPSPSPSPSGSASPSPSATAPPPPPVGYFSPLPANPSPGPNLGGSEGLIDPSPMPHNPSGIAECDDDDGTYSKVGQAPLQPLHDTSFPGSVNPLDYLPWVGNMVSNVPIVVSNAAQWSVNTGVDFVVPGDCVADILTEQQAALFEEGPLSVYVDVTEQVEAAIAATAAAEAAGNCTFQVPLFGGGSECIPYADWAEEVNGVRNFLVVGIWFFTAIGVYRIIVGAWGVMKADMASGNSERQERWVS